MSLSEEEKELIKNRERFRGYQLPKIQLDETGPAYYDVGVHPYFYNQPEFWQQEVFGSYYYGGADDLIESSNPVIVDTAGQSEKALNEPNIPNDTNEIKGQLYKLLPPEK